jgi:hypothetical protein
MPRATADRRTVVLPFGFIDTSGEVHTTAEVRPITGADEYRVGLSKEYTLQPTDAVYESAVDADDSRRCGDPQRVADRAGAWSARRDAARPVRHGPGGSRRPGSDGAVRSVGGLGVPS